MAQAHIHLANIKANACAIQAYAGDAQVLAVIKANAYGHGATQVAQALADSVDAFAVARLAEAHSLSLLGLTQPIVILSEAIDAALLAQCSANRFQPVIHTADAATALCESTLQQPINIWLKIDTGMHRLGLSPAQLNDVLARLENSANVASITLMSHLASADDAAGASYEQQLALFESTTGNTDLPRSIANTAACLRNSNTHYNWVRPGIGLYGHNPLNAFVESPVNLHTSMTLSAPIIGLHAVKAGQSVGYGDTWHAPRDSTIATVAIGYADGYPRHAANGTPTAVGGVIAPLVGRVSMDMISIDVTDAMNTGVKVGDSVECWGEHVSIDEVARCAGTIAYTLFCGLGPRVVRCYNEER